MDVSHEIILFLLFPPLSSSRPSPQITTGVYNVLEGCDGEIEMKPGLTEDEIGQIR